MNTYVSLKQDPRGSYVYAFTVNWAQFICTYVFPPFCLIGRSLQKIALEQAIVIPVVLFWTTPSWFTKLLELLVDQLLVFQVTTNVLFHSLKRNVHPESPKLLFLDEKYQGTIHLMQHFGRHCQ